MNWIVVTGDSGGVGNAVVREILSTTDYGVIGLSRHTNEKIEAVLKEYPDTFKHFDFDLGKPEEISKIYHEKISKVGRIYGLVNNAANAYDDIVTNLQVMPLEKMFRINVYSPMMLTKYAIRDMLVSRTKGSIVHISSVSAHTGYKGLAMYAATKGALEAFSKGVSREWGTRGIRSNVVAPGFMETTISASLTDEQRSKIYQRTSLKKATEVMSVAKTVVFLLTGAACSVTGSVFQVDNGTV